MSSEAAKGRFYTGTSARAARREVRGPLGKRSKAMRIEAKAAWLSGRYPSLVALGRVLGVSAATLAAWRKEDEWGDAAVAVEARATQLAMIEVSNDLEVVKRKHLEHAVRLQDKGRAELETVAAEDVGDAIRMIETGVKLERQALGVDDLGSAAIDGLLSGEIIAAALERQRVLLVKKSG